MTVTETPTTAIRLQPAYADPAAVVAAIRGAAPYWPLARYAANDAERVATGADADTRSFVPPWFRMDFALGGEVLVEGAEVILDNPAFAAAADEVFGGGNVVVPDTVYVNVMAPTAFAFVPHLDVPAFRGARRDVLPVWFLKQMRASQLFEEHRIRLATAVSWFYDGPGGEFHYWPAGPDGPGAVERPPFDNVAVVADNEATFHGVAGLGDPARMPRSLTANAEMARHGDAHGAGEWVITEAGAEVDRYPDAEVRMTVSWKAEVYRDEAERAAVLDGADDLDLDRIVEVFLADLAERGLDHHRPPADHAAMLVDETWIRTLTAAYPDPPPKIA